MVLDWNNTLNDESNKIKLLYNDDSGLIIWRWNLVHLDLNTFKLSTQKPPTILEKKI